MRFVSLAVFGLLAACTRCGACEETPTRPLAASESEAPVAAEQPAAPPPRRRCDLRLVWSRELASDRRADAILAGRSGLLVSTRRSRDQGASDPYDCAFAPTVHKVALDGASASEIVPLSRCTSAFPRPAVLALLHDDPAAITCTSGPASPLHCRVDAPFDEVFDGREFDAGPAVLGAGWAIDFAFLGARLVGAATHAGGLLGLSTGPTGAVTQSVLARGVGDPFAQPMDLRVRVEGDVALASWIVRGASRGAAVRFGADGRARGEPIEIGPSALEVAAGPRIEAVTVAAADGRELGAVRVHTSGDVDPPRVPAAPTTRRDRHGRDITDLPPGAPNLVPIRGLDETEPRRDPQSARVGEFVVLATLRGVGETAEAAFVALAHDALETVGAELRIRGEWPIADRTELASYGGRAFAAWSARTSPEAPWVARVAELGCADVGATP